ncbi:MAG TPA: hypothetical protein DCL44_03920 [Elusimicrobia bacterium]|nr:hypothetical protein [Elusimicrobiota bacterium]
MALMKKIEFSDLEFEDLLRCEPEAGRLFFNNRRALIFDAATMGILRQHLFNTTGWDLSMGILSRFGYEHGYNDAKMLGKMFNWKTDTDWLASGPFIHTLEGLVHVTPQKIEFDRKTGHFHMHGIWRNSYEAETHLKLFGRSARGPVCWTLTGYASGYASCFFGKNLLAIETECVGKGDARCYFEIRPVDKWGGEALSYLNALKAVDVAGQLREAENRFYDIALISSDWIWEVNADGLYTYCSLGVTRILGYTPEELVKKKHFYDLFHPEERERMKTMQLGIFAKKEAFNLAVSRNRHKNGEPVILETKGVPILDNDGKLLGYRGSATDITGRKRAEDALCEAEEKYRMQFEGALDAIFVADPETGLLIDLNLAATKLVGREKSELIGRHQQILHPFPIPGEKLSDDTFNRHVNGEQGLILESKVITKTGEIKDVAIMGTMLKIKGRQVLQGIFRDVTVQKKLEAGLQRSEKLSAIGQLAAGVAHEINNPLGIILGFAQSVVKRIKESDSLFLPLKSIEREAVRCKDLVQSLLVFSRSSQNEKLEELDLNAAMEGSLTLILSQTKTRNVELVRELCSGLPRINANRSHIQQVLINLANNAIDAMPEGGTLIISTSLSARQPGHVEIRVRDTGTGIPKEIQKKIFDPFFTTKEVGKGTGLGLSLVYEIVSKHGGTVELESEEGKGTEFTVFLPVSAASPATGDSL